MVNSDCNQSCGHCYLGYSGKRSPESTLELTRDFKERGYDIIIAGSETLLDTGYLESYRAAGQKYILTNGKLIAKDLSLCDKLISYGIREVRMSLLHGLEARLGSVRKDIIKKAVRTALNAGLKVQLAAVISQDNYQDIGAICREAVELGVDSQEFLRYMKVGRAKGTDVETITEEQRQSVFDQIQVARRIFNKTLKVRINGNFGPRKGTLGEKMASQGKYCPAGEHMFAITPNNRVYGCPGLTEWPIGRLVDGRIMVVSDLPKERKDCIADKI
ncbi:hypothetical protein COV93_06635 [Candidatus Woesearchaeota archaeon CG11_big_fil_rev_8_21_14_0_20_43_8]|nr:MAG: hypothetical protein COV93_06635 [Candidatus Woesearchaeota archaeon CG11_big_fil_rev_8_21_14_0_20_43_8]